jgi:hypothetical protein
VSQSYDPRQLNDIHPYDKGWFVFATWVDKFGWTYYYPFYSYVDAQGQHMLVLAKCGYKYCHGVAYNEVALYMNFWPALTLFTLFAMLRYRKWRLLCEVRESGESQKCLRCGYDLRASKDRCPECGTPIPLDSAHGGPVDKTRDRPTMTDLKPPESEPPPEPLPPS